MIVILTFTHYVDLTENGKEIIKLSFIKLKFLNTTLSDLDLYLNSFGN